MQISLKDVEHIARLARLALTDAEKEEYTRQLNQVLEHMDKLQELNTDNVPPTYHILSDLVNVLRKDQATPGLTLEQALQNAPDRAGDGFRVPKIIEG